MFQLQLVAVMYNVIYSTLDQPTAVNSRLECACLCFHQANCSSFFYWSGHCRPTHHLYTVYNQSMQTAGAQYFVWVSDRCSLGYDWYRPLEVCFRVSTLWLSWEEAEYQCGSEGGHLLTVDSPELHDFMAYLVTDYDKPLWIGGKTVDGTEWLWADGSFFNTTFWDSDEPDGVSNKCLMVNKESKMWRDVPCSEKRRFVCALPLPGKLLC